MSFSIYVAIIIVLLVLILGTLVFGRITKPSVFDEYYYFDANATTPMSQETLGILTKSAHLGNASTDYANHNGASTVIASASNLVLGILNARHHQCIFNSGCSEGNSYVFRTVSELPIRKPHIIVSSIEHKSSIATIEHLVRLDRLDVTWVHPNSDGIVDPISVAEAVQERTVLISVMHANNETGVVQPLAEIGRIAKAYNLIFHSDAAQSFCKLKIDMEAWNLDIVTSSMHKVYGPIGTGIIVISKRLAAFGIGQIGGTQFYGLRGGTENLAAIAASEHAIRTTLQNRQHKNDKLLRYKLHILNSLQNKFELYGYTGFSGQPDSFIPFGGTSAPKIGFAVLGDPVRSLPGTLLLSIFKVGQYNMEDRFCNIKLKQALFERKIIISIGSACNTHSAGPSHVLLALRAPFVIRSGVIRISLSDLVDQNKIDYLIKNLIECIQLQN